MAPRNSCTTGVYSLPIPIAILLASRPKLGEVLDFKTQSGSSIKIAQQIGEQYYLLGSLLLKDDMGELTSVIVKQHQHQHNVALINERILLQWLQGKGKKPVSWSTLINVLKTMGLSELAQLVQKELQTSSTPATVKPATPR